MDRRIKFRHIETFVGIARAKSLKRAAEQLNLTQPAISKTLKELETIVETRLMDRDRAGVRLTASGDVFLLFAEQSLTALQSGLTSLSTLAEDSATPLRVGALPSVSSHLLPRTVANFRSNSPGTVVQINEGRFDDLMDRLRAGALDLVVGRLGPPDAMKSLSFTQLYTEDVIIVAAPDHPLAGATGLDQLLGYPILYPPRGSAIRPLVARQMIARGLPLFSNRIECASADFGRAYLAGPERALWFISQGVVAADLAAGRMVQLPIELPVTNGPIGILARSEEVPSPAAHLFRQALIAASQRAT